MCRKPTAQGGNGPSPETYLVVQMQTERVRLLVSSVIREMEMQPQGMRFFGGRRTRRVGEHWAGRRREEKSVSTGLGGGVKGIDSPLVITRGPTCQLLGHSCSAPPEPWEKGSHHGHTETGACSGETEAQRCRGRGGWTPQGALAEGRTAMSHTHPHPLCPSFGDSVEGHSGYGQPGRPGPTHSWWEGK